MVNKEMSHFSRDPALLMCNTVF